MFVQQPGQSASHKVLLVISQYYAALLLKELPETAVSVG